MLSEDLFKSKNPYGELSTGDLERFEKSIGFLLPPEYREYLLQFNGAEPHKASFFSHLGSKESFGIHHVYGLHSGPHYFRLQDNWRLQDYYSLCAHGDYLKQFLVFADCGTGELATINLLSGTIHLLDPEALHLPDGLSRFRTPVLNGTSFNKFILSLITLSDV